jgi:POT family proton-dependent oligopeptide transporter
MTSTTDSTSASEMNSTAPSKRWPSQIKYILGNEAAERFSYYGMKGILALYITGVLMRTRDNATEIIHLFGFTNYFMPLLGAWLSDRYWGRYNTILFISLFYCLGHGVLACSDLLNTPDSKLLCLYGGLALIAFGSGGIKPCVSAFMGDQFKPEQSQLLQKAYAAFYWSINLGSVASFLIIPWIRDTHGYGWAFGVPGLAMALATFVFWLGTPQYRRVPPSAKTNSAGFFKVLGYAVSHRSERKPGTGFWDTALQKFTPAEVDAAKSVAPILGVFSLVPMFWALYDQTFSTWVLQGEKMIPLMIGSYKFGAEQMLSSNAVMIMVLVPIMTLWLYPMMGRLASPLRRISYGMFLAALTYVIVAWFQLKIDQGAHLSILWQLVPYIVLSCAEVLVSTTGLEFAFREAAPSMKSMVQSFFLLTIALGNLLVAVVTGLSKYFVSSGAEGNNSISPGMFLFYAVTTFIVAIAFSVAASFYRYRDPTAALGK